LTSHAVKTASERGSDRQLIVYEVLGRSAAHALEQDRPDVLKRRRAWFNGQLDLDPERLVFIDGETDKQSIQ
jgi:hypothetical protein